LVFSDFLLDLTGCKVLKPDLIGTGRNKL